MRSIIIGLAVLFVVLQYQLWFTKDGLLSAWQWRTEIEQQKLVNAELSGRNAQLQQDIKNLKHHGEFIESRARSDSGMIKKDETFYQVIKSGHDKND